MESESTVIWTTAFIKHAPSVVNSYCIPNCFRQGFSNLGLKHNEMSYIIHYKYWLRGRNPKWAN